MYSIDFVKIQHVCNSDSVNFKGIYWDSIPEDINNYGYILSQVQSIDNKYKHYPILYINEAIEEHYTQIIFLLKEYFTVRNEGFKGWRLFTKNELIDIFNNDKYIYIENFSNGQEFVNKFPNAIEFFLENYCIKDN
tara:strand:- start:1114 stop:1521 length:408 start_codon:yes stop_codon:yes gene_type:complete